MSSLLIPPPEDPVRAAAQWVGEAEALGRRNANAMALASTDAAGSPSVRMVLLKELVPLGYAVFYTNYGSRKGAELAATGRAAAVLYWHELGRQVRFEGRVVRSPAVESDRYFASRAPASQVNACSSEQSRPLADPAALEERAARIAATRTAGQGLVRPAHWGGFRLWFEAIELWVEGENRFHERVRYERKLDVRDAHSFDAGRWNWQRLQP
jgi:pyridoxamine 5'-phosphate oxidase